MSKYKLKRDGIPIEDLMDVLPNSEEFVKYCKSLGHDTVQSLFGASVALRVGECLNEFAKTYNLTHKEIHQACGELLSKEDLIRLSGPIPKYGTGSLR